MYADFKICLRLGLGTLIWLIHVSPFRAVFIVKLGPLSIWFIIRRFKGVLKAFSDAIIHDKWKLTRNCDFSVFYSRFDNRIPSSVFFQPRKSNLSSLKMKRYTKSTMVNTNNMGTNIRTTSLIKTVTKILTNMRKKRTFTVMETTKHIIPNMQITQHLLKPTVK